MRLGWKKVISVLQVIQKLATIVAAARPFLFYYFLEKEIESMCVCL